jgi:hypothetical protein
MSNFGLYAAASSHWVLQPNPPKTIILVPFHTAEAPSRAVSGDGAITRHLRATGSYAAPSARLFPELALPPHTSISFVVVAHTATCAFRPAVVAGTASSARHAPFAGSYLAPSLRYPPPQRMASVPLHTIVWRSRALSVVLGRAAHRSVTGSYVAPSPA